MPRTVQRVPLWLADAALAVGAAALAAGVTTMVVTSDASGVPWYVAHTIGLLAATVVRVRAPRLVLSGWLCLVPAADLLAEVAGNLVFEALDRGWSTWAVAWLNLGEQLAVTIGLLSGVLVLILMPDGVVRSRFEQRTLSVVRWFPLLPVVLAPTTAYVSLPSWADVDAVPNPMHVGRASIDVGIAQAIIELASAVLILALVLVVVRYRRSGAADRRRLRWLLLPMLLAAFAITLSFFTFPPVVFATSTVVTSGSLAVAVALALLAPKRLDVDVVLHTSLVYGVMWIVIALSYVGVSALFGVAIGQRASSTWAVAVTLIAMVALQPVRAGVQRLTGRWLFGARPDPRRAIVELGQSLEHTYDLDTLLPQIAAALESGLGVQWARVELGDTPSTAGDAALTVPVAFGGEQLGILECGPKAKGELDADDVALVETLARQAALAIRNVKLTAELKDRTTELSESRARLVQAGETERRRIERNIHDGVQQELVALIAQSGMVRRQLNRDGTVVADDLDQLQSGLKHVLLELRELSAGIHPSLLRDRGLLVAVEALAARHPVSVQVRADPALIDLRLPPVVEGAAYFAIAESLANSLKHADARHCDVALTRSNGTVAVAVGDDGRGFEPARRQLNGLRSLSERLAAIGGSLNVTSQPGCGTTISATVPIAPTRGAT